MRPTRELKMTPRQQEAAALAAEGMTYKEIGKALGVSRNTARSHIIALANRLPGDSKRPLWRVRQWMLTREHAA
jgi:DNA-binding NarL/FixJ family response regulator